MADNTSFIPTQNSPLEGWQMKSDGVDYPPSDWIETTLGPIPKDWKIISANEFCDKVADGTHDSPKQSEHGKLLITSKNLKDGQLDISSAYLISLKDFEEVNKRSKVDKWDILLSMIGTVGEVCLISQEPEFAIKNVGLFKCGEESNAKWLYYFLRSSIGQNHLLSRLSGTTQKYITLGELRNFPIIIPKDPAEQKAIISVLSAFDDKIELLREQNKTLEEMGQTIFKEWFLPSRQAGGKYGVDDELIKAQELLEFEKGIEVGSNNYFANKDDLENPEMFYRVGDIENNGNLSSLYCEKDLLKNKLFKNEDILVSFDGTVGRVFFGGNGGYSSGIRKIYDKDGDIKSSFLYFWAKSATVQETINLYSEGTTIQHAGRSIPYLEIISNQESIDKISESLNPIFKKISDNIFQIQSLARSRDELLPKLMSGLVRVNHS